ncbi:MAG: hypothetical protein KJO44_06330, partial [Gemmatimonadetes bacterium]|nr:hypothetical protein [Gemmatimonadota bacterium]
MPAIRLCFLIAGLVTAVHAFATYGAVNDWTVAVRNLLWWQILTSLAGGVIALLAWIAFRGRTMAWVGAPTAIVGLELSAWLVAENLHHTLSPAPKLGSFALAWLLPAIVFYAWGRAKPTLRWMSSVQIAILIAAVGLGVLSRSPASDPEDRPDLALFVLDAVQV